MLVPLGVRAISTDVLYQRCECRPLLFVLSMLTRIYAAEQVRDMEVCTRPGKFHDSPTRSLSVPSEGACWMYAPHL
jgi:hypothetical protein